MMFGIISVILEAIPRIFNIIWSILCGPIYYLISIFYEVFITLPRINILRDLNIEGIYQRVTMILVIVMAFYITFEVVKYVVQPDIITDKEKGSGKLIQKIIIVILLIAFVPKIFDIAYELQGRIIRSDIFAKVLLDDYKETENTINNMGGNFSANVYSLFYHVNEDVCPMTDSGELDKSKISSWNLFNCQEGKMIVDNNLMILRGVSTVQVVGGVLAPITSLGQTIGLNLTATNSQGDTDFVITFNGLLALGVGIFILWTLIVYGVELAKRVFQLIYLQIIAPVAIISYIAPKKDGMLSKWTKQCITTYLDLFIRLAIINFILLIISLLHESFFDTDSLIQSFIKDWGITPRVDVLFWVYIMLIIGLLNFAKKAPKMLSELFPSSGAAAGSYGFSGKDNLFAPIKSVVGTTSRAIGGTVGAYTGIKTAMGSAHLKGSQNKKDRLWSAAKAGFAGAKAGYSKGGGIRKANAAALASVHSDEDIVIGEGTVLGSQFQGNKYAQEAKGYDREKKQLEDAAKVKDDGKKIASGHGFMKQVNSTKSELEHRNIADAASIGGWFKSMEKVLPDLSIDHDKTKAKDTIDKATQTLFDAERNKINSNADIQKTIVQKELNVARNQHKQANDIISNYETFIGPLTERQQLEKENAIKTVNITEQKIRESEDKLKEIESNQKIELSKISNEENALAETLYKRIVEKTTDSSGNVIETFADGDVLAQMKNTYTQGYKDSVGTYVTPDGKEMTVYETEEEAIEIAKKRAQTSGKTVEEELQYVHKNHIDLETYVKNIGKIQDSANTQISNMSIDPKVRQAKANAAASGKSGK